MRWQEDYYDCVIFGPTHLSPQIEPLLRQYKVDILVSGHLHNYERSWPNFNGTVTAKSYSDPTAPISIIVGGSGDSEGLTYDFHFPIQEWSAYHAAELGYGRLLFLSPQNAVFQYVQSITGQILDEINITRSAPLYAAGDAVVV